MKIKWKAGYANSIFKKINNNIFLFIPKIFKNLAKKNIENIAKLGLKYAEIDKKIVFKIAYLNK